MNEEMKPVNLAQRVADLEDALKTVHEQSSDRHRKAVEARAEVAALKGGAV